MEHLANGAEALVTDEKLEDTARDAIGYSLLILDYLRKKAATHA
jgi:IMP cyclohydrolase